MIKFIRESTWFKAFSLFLAITILNLACSQSDIIPIKTLDNKIEYRNSVQIPDGAHIARDFELSYELVSSINNSEGHTSFQELSKEFFEGSEQLQDVNAEVAKYSNLGFDDYLEDIVERNIVSFEFKKEMVDFKNELTNFIYSNQPIKEDFISFIANKKTTIHQSNLSEETIKNMNLYLDLVEGHTNYMYKEYSNTNGNLNLRTSTDCDSFWAKLLCASLTLIVGFTVFIIVWALVTMGILRIGGNPTVTAPDGPPTDFPGQPGSKTLKGDDAIIVISALIAVAIGIEAGDKFHSWCCSWFSDESDQECLPPSGYFVQKIGCNKFKYRIYGPSNYGATEWYNENTLPSNSITLYPSLVFSVEQLGTESTISANITCKENSSSIILYDYGPETELFDTEEGEFSLWWIEAPPETFLFEGNPGGDIPEFENIFSVRVNTANNTDVYSYDWDVESPHQFVLGAGSKDNYATVKCIEPTFVTTSVLVTNICTGQVESVSGTTLITQ